MAWAAERWPEPTEACTTKMSGGAAASSAVRSGAASAHAMASAAVAPWAPAARGEGEGSAGTASVWAGASGAIGAEGSVDFSAGVFMEAIIAYFPRIGPASAASPPRCQKIRLWVAGAFRRFGQSFSRGIFRAPAFI